jgi:TRAP-type C4-dicarboxylate transport system permease small subunit
MNVMNISKLLDTIDKAVLGFIKWFTISLFVLIAGFLCIDVINRYLPLVALNWKEEVVELLFAFLVFFGAAAAWILKGHFSAGDWIERAIKGPRLKAGFKLFTDLISLAFILVLFFYSLDLVDRSLETTAVLLIPRKLIYLCMPASAGIMALYSFKFIVLDAIGVFRPRSNDQEGREEG